MSFNKTTHHPVFFFIALSPVTLISALNASYVHAENGGYYQQEPIIPIPQKIEADINKARLGEILFFDKRLSKTNKIACASCHQLDAGGDDNVVMSLFMAIDQPIVNTPGIFNVRYNFRQNWDGSINTLQQQIDAVITNRHKFDNTWDKLVLKLAGDMSLTKDFNEIYEDGITKNNIIDVIVEFEKTLVTPNSRFDQYLKNQQEGLTKEEIKGYELFKELGCISCHQGINIGGNLFQKFGIFYNYIAERGNIQKPDFGRMNVTNRNIDKFVFKVPSLRNVAVTAPYLHDGSAETIEDAINIMGKTQLGRTLSKNEIFLIKTFLNTLTGEYKNKPLDAQS